MRALIDASQAKDFILKLLKSDPQERLTVQEAMDHPVRLKFMMHNLAKDGCSG